ncbi:MAG: PilT/PilU family type 4a pilus ATPase [Candidatus Latescibacteria bacterium]|nr:PilT/PilU family type 4a pilus ATPase [Candidatus Latescibacterota bacterium]
MITTKTKEELFFDDLLGECIRRNASDLHLTVGLPPVLRVDGVLRPVEKAAVLEPAFTETIKNITVENAPQIKHLITEDGGADFSLNFKNLARFRVAIYRQKGCYGLALRLIPNNILPFEELGFLPNQVPRIKNLLNRPHGLILVTGPTGSGKTTTQATFVDYILESPCHVLTIEDPIEFVHSHKNGLITQREVGVDVPSFREAIMKGLRSNPNVILVAEIRDVATAEATIWAAESGHLVIGTLHTTNASETVTRFIDVFPPEIRDQIRIQFSISLLAIFAQRLLPRATGRGRIGVFEIMSATPAVRNLIRERKIEHLPSAIQSSVAEGSCTFDSALAELYRAGKITFEIALMNAFDPRALREMVEFGIKSRYAKG